MGKIEKTSKFVRLAWVLSSFLVFSFFLSPSAMAVENVEPDVTVSPTDSSTDSPTVFPLPEPVVTSPGPTPVIPEVTQPAGNVLPPLPAPVVPEAPLVPPAPVVPPVETPPTAAVETTAPVETPEPEEELVLPIEEATPTESAAAVPVVTPPPLATPSKAAAVPMKVQAQKITESVVATGSSPVVQALVIAFLLLLGFWYFRIMRHGGKRGPAASLKTGE